MRRHRRVYAPALTALALALFLGSAAPADAGRRQPQTRDAAAPQRGPAPEISYTVSMPRPDTHLLEVEMRLRWPAGSAPQTADLVMPVWTPGSYLIREYERHVQDFAADDGGGRALQWQKANKNTWRVTLSGGGGARELRARYRVYSNELTVRTNELNDRHAFWNNAALLMYPEGHLAAPSTLRVVAPREWKIATGLPPVSGSRDTFRAENFDILYDSPFLVSDFRLITFEAGGRQHRVALDGPGNYDPAALERDMKKVTEAAIRLIGDAPFRDYTFLVVLTARGGGGGLEHLNSTALVVNTFNFRPDAVYRDFLGLVAHEYFHLWNVKRIRPDALGPFDYTTENHTRLLWVAEGLTSYYGDLLVRRAGLMSDKDYLEATARAIEGLQNTPGRQKMSVEEASFDAWIRYYRADENSVNVSISYYDKGAIVGLLLDLEIRRRTAGARSLDDVMRQLYTEFAQRNRNYTPEDFQRAAERQAGGSLEEFFSRYVRGREELDYNAALSVVGLRLDTTGGADPSKPPAARAYLGGSLAQDGDRLLVRGVQAGTPAYDQGLYAGDQILAVDGYRASLNFLNARLAEKKPGDNVTLTVFRTDELRTLTVKLGSRTEGAYRIVPVASPTAEQMRLYESWLGAPFPKPAAK